MSESHHDQIARFGVFELDLTAGELWRGGRRVALTGQPIRVLTLLVTRAGEVVARDELRREIWGDTHVDFEAGLATCINQIRAALGDRAASPRFVETLPRRGYRFIAPVQLPTTDDQPVEGTNVAARWVSRRTVSMTTVALVVMITALLISLAERRGPTPVLIAVLPVAVDSSRSDLNAISLSLTDALIGTLASESGRRAKVASPLAVRHLRERDKTLDDVRAVGAEYFVDVALRSLGNPVLVHAKLAHISGWILWTSDQEMTVDELQRQQLSIAQQLARRIATEILPSAKARRAPKAEAIGDYAQATADLENGRIAESLAGFQRAFAVDANHPATLAGLAAAHVDAAAKGLVNRDRAYEGAAALARRALELDPTNARAQAVLSRLRHSH